MDRNEKKKKVSDLGKKKHLSSIKSCESVGNAKQTIFYFWPDPVQILGCILSILITNEI